MNVANNYFPHKIIAFSSVSHSGFMVVKLNKLNLLQIPIWSKSRGRIEIPKAPLLGGNKDLIAQVHTAPCAEHITFYFLPLLRSFIPNRRAAEEKKFSDHLRNGANARSSQSQLAVKLLNTDFLIK